SQADDPESGIKQAQEAEHAQTNPVGRHEHTGRPRVECCLDIVPESGLHGVFILRFAASFSNTARKASVTTSAAFLNSGRSWAISGDIPIEGGILSRMS